MRELNVIQDGALLIRNGVIEDVGISRRVERLASARAATEINATGKVVMPAFIDGAARVASAHTGLAAEEGASAEPRRDLRQGILDGARALKAMTRQRLESRCRAILENMVRHGTVAVEVQTGYGLDAPGEMKTLRVHRALNGKPSELVSTYLASVAPPEFQHDPAAYLTEVAEPLLASIAERKLASFAAVRCSPDGFDVDSARKFLETARRLGLAVKLQAQAGEPGEVVALAIELAAISISHLEHISPADVNLLAKFNTIATLCPGAAYESGSGRFAPARSLIDAGAAVSLASNFNPESSPFYSMPFILSLACRHTGMTPAESVSAATINAAYAAGLGARMGSIEPGKQANLLIFDARDYREIPYYAGANSVHMTVKDGIAVYESGRLNQ